MKETAPNAVKLTQFFFLPQRAQRTREAANAAIRDVTYALFAHK